MSSIIHSWVLSLIKSNPDKNLFSSDFILEDGMSLEDYINYEKYQFDNLSEIYDLDENFSINILYTFQMEDRSIVYFYIINKFNKIVCKMSLTTDNTTGLLASNNSVVQAVPKFTIENDKITQIGLAIKPKYSLKKIFCTDYDLISFHQGDNYKNDFFYTAKFECDNKVQNNLLIFTFVMKNEDNDKLLIERKPIYFDIFDKNLKPFKIENQELFLLDDKYPVHLSTWSSTGENENYEYPRKLILPLKDKSYFTITDSIDNDWIVKI